MRVVPRRVLPFVPNYGEEGRFYFLCGLKKIPLVIGGESIQMPWYFTVDTYIDEQKGRGMYEDYIREVKPIVESYGGEYLVRTDSLRCLSDERVPQRVIIIRFEHKEDLDLCFSSPEYRAIMSKRADSVDSRAVIVEGIR